jgi:hypothetical protein
VSAASHDGSLILKSHIDSLAVVPFDQFWHG